MFKKTEGEKADDKSHKKKAKEVAVTIAVMAVMLVPFVGIDCIYYMRHSCAWAEGIVNGCYVALQTCGITYTSLMDNIGGAIGTIITIISLLFSTNIYRIQRLDNNTFGISYKEIQNAERGIGQSIEKYTRRMSYLAPFILMLVINFRLCVTGYLLYFYCCVSVVSQCLLYASSFSRDGIPRKVAVVLLKMLPEKGKWRFDDIQRFDIRLKDVGRSVELEKNWIEVEVLFEALLHKLQTVSEENQQLIMCHFYRIVCCEQKENTMLMHRIWNIYLKQENKRAVQNIRQENNLNKEIKVEACFWGMLQGAIYTISEKELILFIKDFLEFRQQGIAAYSIKEQSPKGMLKYLKSTDIVPSGHKVVEKILGEELLSKRCCLFLILLECRFRTATPESVEMAALVQRLKEYANVELNKMQKSKIFEDIYKYVEDVKQQELIQDIVVEMIDDRKNRTSKCCINNFPAI